MEELKSSLTALSRRINALESADIVGSQFHQDSGDTAWMLSSAVFVIFMTMPGLGLYYCGMVRVKNVLATLMQIFSITCLVTILWLCFGYSLSFSPIIPSSSSHKYLVYGDAQRFWLRGISHNQSNEIASTIPETVFCVFQLSFAIITAALICGSFADRMAFIPMMIFIACWHLVVYCPIAHAVWHHDGFLHNAGLLDYAGGSVVHISAGMAGLASTLVLGQRQGYGCERFEPYNVLITFIGLSILSVGWLQFNGGSAMAANASSGNAMLMTRISCAVASFSWVITELVMKKKPNLLGMINGAVAGLVSITPGAGYVDATGAFVIGLLAGPVSYIGVTVKNYFRCDDALDAFGVHAISGCYGCLMVGLFAVDDSESGATNESVGLFYGSESDGGRQLAVQLYGAVVCATWSFVGAFVILWTIDRLIGCRVSCEEELSGLDLLINGNAPIATPVSNPSSSNPSRQELRHNGFGSTTTLSGPSNDFVDGDGNAIDFVDYDLTAKYRSLNRPANMQSSSLSVGKRDPSLGKSTSFTDLEFFRALETNLHGGKVSTTSTTTIANGQAISNSRAILHFKNFSKSIGSRRFNTGIWSDNNCYQQIIDDRIDIADILDAASINTDSSRRLQGQQHRRHKKLLAADSSNSRRPIEEMHFFLFLLTGEDFRVNFRELCSTTTHFGRLSRFTTLAMLNLKFRAGAGLPEEDSHGSGAGSDHSSTRGAVELWQQISVWVNASMQQWILALSVSRCLDVTASVDDGQELILADHEYLVLLFSIAILSSSCTGHQLTVTDGLANNVIGLLQLTAALEITKKVSMGVLSTVTACACKLLTVYLIKNDCALSESLSSSGDSHAHDVGVAQADSLESSSHSTASASTSSSTPLTPLQPLLSSENATQLCDVAVRLMDTFSSSVETMIGVCSMMTTLYNSHPTCVQTVFTDAYNCEIFCNVLDMNFMNQRRNDSQYLRSFKIEQIVRCWLEMTNLLALDRQSFNRLINTPEDCNRILRPAEAFHKNHLIVLSVCSIILRFTLNNTIAKDILVEAGSCDVIAKILKHHRDGDQSVILAANQAMLSLATGSVEVQQGLINTKLPRLIIEQMSHFMSISDLFSNASIAESAGTIFNLMTRSVDQSHAPTGEVHCLRDILVRAIINDDGCRILLDSLRDIHATRFIDQYSATYCTLMCQTITNIVDIGEPLVIRVFVHYGAAQAFCETCWDNQESLDIQTVALGGILQLLRAMCPPRHRDNEGEGFMGSRLHSRHILRCDQVQQEHIDLSVDYVKFVGELWQHQLCDIMMSSCQRYGRLLAMTTSAPPLNLTTAVQHFNSICMRILLFVHFTTAAQLTALDNRRVITCPMAFNSRNFDRKSIVIVPSAVTLPFNQLVLAWSLEEVVKECRWRRRRYFLVVVTGLLRQHDMTGCLTSDLMMSGSSAQTQPASAHMMLLSTWTAGVMSMWTRSSTRHTHQSSARGRGGGGGGDTSRIFASSHTGHDMMINNSTDTGDIECLQWASDMSSTSSSSVPRKSSPPPYTSPRSLRVTISNSNYDTVSPHDKDNEDDNQDHNPETLLTGSPAIDNQLAQHEHQQFLIILAVFGCGPLCRCIASFL